MSYIFSIPPKPKRGRPRAKVPVAPKRRVVAPDHDIIEVITAAPDHDRIEVIAEINPVPEEMQQPQEQEIPVQLTAFI